VCVRTWQLTEVTAVKRTLITCSCTTSSSSVLQNKNNHHTGKFVEQVLGLVE
jgi:hypothetical protein